MPGIVSIVDLFSVKISVLIIDSFFSLLAKI